MNDCWAQSLGDCSDKMSREHIFSEGVHFADKVFVQGLSWCKDEPREVGLSSLTAKILCKKHNSEISFADAAATSTIKFFEESIRLYGFRSQHRRTNWHTNKLQGKWIRTGKLVPQDSKPAGPFLIFDKSSLESLDLDEAVMLDNFFMSNITPLFFVECLADLEKAIRSKSTPEQLVGSLATRTPESQSYPNVHHARILRGELAGKFDLQTARGRVMLAGGKHVQLGEKKGAIFEHSPEAEAVSRWGKREFLELERNIARQWRRSLTGTDLSAMAQDALSALGHWRKPRRCRTRGR